MYNSDNINHSYMIPGGGNDILVQRVDMVVQCTQIVHTNVYQKGKINLDIWSGENKSKNTSINENSN